MSEEIITVRCTKCDEWIAWEIDSDADPICIECEKVPLSRALAAERTAAELRAQLERVTAQYNTLKEMYRTDHDQSIRQEETIKQLNSEIKYLRSTDNAADLAFERMAPLDWRESEQETPYGHMLDGLGDEVEP